MSIVESLRPRLTLRERIEKSGQSRSDVPLEGRALMARNMCEVLLDVVANTEMREQVDGVEAQALMVSVLEDLAWLLGDDNS